MTVQYILHYDYIPDVLEKRGPYRDGHLGLAKKMLSEGLLVTGGPTGEPGKTPNGAALVFTTEEAAKAFVAGDPYIPNGIVTGYKIVEWTITVKKDD